MGRYRLSYRVKTIFFLRKKVLRDFTIEDLRIYVGQSFSLPFLIPLAINKLKVEILAEGDLYPGDLLQSVLKSDINFWKENINQWRVVKEICSQNIQKINTDRQISKSLESFISIHEHN